jgi:hypothetical protein
MPPRARINIRAAPPQSPERAVTNPRASARSHRGVADRASGPPTSRCSPGNRPRPRAAPSCDPRGRRSPPADTAWDPRRGRPTHAGRRRTSTRSGWNRSSRQRRPEVAGREAVEVQDRQHLGDRCAYAGRIRELNRLRFPGSPHRRACHSRAARGPAPSRADGQPPRAVADDQSMAVLAYLVGERRHVLVDLRLKRGRDHSAARPPAPSSSSVTRSPRCPPRPRACEVPTWRAFLSRFTAVDLRQPGRYGALLLTRIHNLGSSPEPT